MRITFGRAVTVLLLLAAAAGVVWSAHAAAGAGRVAQR